MPRSRIPKDSERLVPKNFITEIIDEDLRSGRYDLIVTRFPPEPNGYPHIGHAIASFIDCGIAKDYQGRCHLRMDDTNPLTEEQRYVDAIIRDMRWLGWDWGEHLYYASDYFERLYEMAVDLIKRGLAYVDSLPEEKIREYRGTPDRPGTPSPYRNRSVEENLKLFEEMRACKHPEGAHVLRAKIDMASPNMKLRDPILYRILRAEHYRTGKRWCIYPMYDFAHPLSDFIEGVTHSLCSSEFIENRAVYDWLVEKLAGRVGLPAWPRPKQIEFGRRSLEYTVVSKRKLIKLVERGLVSGWDDPRMPTLSGLRRRGVRPQALIAFAQRVGISRTDRTVDLALLEWAIRDDLNPIAPRVMAVSEPLLLELENFEGTAWIEAPYFPPDVGKPGSRKVPFTKRLYVERGDFSLNPPRGWKRLEVGKATRLRHAFVVVIERAVKNDAGEVVKLIGRVVEGSLGTNPPGIKVQGAIHWVSAEHALPAEFRLVDRLFKEPYPDTLEDFLSAYNPDSLIVKRGFVEPSVKDDPRDTRYQFERLGYFWQDPVDSKPGLLVFNRIVTLKDTWARRREEALRASKKAPKPTGEKPRKGARKAPRLNPEEAEIKERCLRLGLGEQEAYLVAKEPAIRAYLEEMSAHLPPDQAAPWVVHTLGPWLRRGENRVPPEDLAELIRLVEAGEVTARQAKQALEEAQATGHPPTAIVKELGLGVLRDEKLVPIIEETLATFPDKVAAYRAGKKGLLGFFIGEVMRKSSGRADPKAVRELLQAKLDRGTPE